MDQNSLADIFLSTYEKNKKQIFKILRREDFYSTQEDAMQYLIDNEYEYQGMDHTEAVETHIGFRLSDWIDDFKREAKFKNGKLLVSRCISVEDVDEFLYRIANGLPAEEYKGLGVYWAWDSRKADCHWGGGGPGVLVNALVDLTAINLLDTVLLNLNPTLGEDEAEIRLKPGAKVEVISVEDDRGEVHSPLDEGLPPIPMTAAKGMDMKKFPVLESVLAARKTQSHCADTWQEGLKEFSNAARTLNRAMAMAKKEKLPAEIKQELKSLLSQMEDAADKLNKLVRSKTFKDADQDV